MTSLWRIWVLLFAGAAILLTAVGMQPRFAGAWWPISGLWLAVGFASFGLSVWVGATLLALGVVMDLMTEAPLGAWSLALLSAYGVALVAWDRQPPISVYAAETIAVIGGMIAASLALSAAGGIAGFPGLDRSGLLADFIITAMLYPAVRFILIPRSIRAARR